ncbi:acyl-CoA reductase [Paucihalobacter sp.]|uniref:acyl-CoA reductase n=1 Tax=Paucihalobacter sp. TaxID=2850405 RepID=UPI002FE1DDBD
MNLQQRINAFSKLGAFLEQFANIKSTQQPNIAHNESFYERFQNTIQKATQSNAWFTYENITFALKNWSQALHSENLENWLSHYTFSEVKPKQVAIIMAGNIPLVGFHDFLSVLISGHKVIVKQSSNDAHLLPIIADYLTAIEPEFENYIQFTTEKLPTFEAVIATGSNNTARYFEYYFKGKPSIIRRNRNSVAVLTGEENEQGLKHLSEDIFRYFGLGCRNVSKLYVPKNYNFDAFFNAIYSWKDIINHHKYANNYDYNKAVYLMSEYDILDNGFFMVKDDASNASPISTVFYEHYNSVNELKSKLLNDKELIQCIVSLPDLDIGIPFGSTQNPQLWDYADNVDTVDFLLTI